MIASFLQTHSHWKKVMNNRFKELGYDRVAKKEFLHQTLGYKKAISNMTLNEIEKVINTLDN